LQPHEGRETIQDEASNIAEEVSSEASKPEEMAEANASDAGDVDSGKGRTEADYVNHLL